MFYNTNERKDEIVSNGHIAKSLEKVKSIVYLCLISVILSDSFILLIDICIIYATYFIILVVILMFRIKMFLSRWKT